MILQWKSLEKSIPGVYKAVTCSLLIVYLGSHKKVLKVLSQFLTLMSFEPPLPFLVLNLSVAPLLVHIFCLNWCLGVPLLLLNHIHQLKQQYPHEVFCLFNTFESFWTLKGLLVTMGVDGVWPLRLREGAGTPSTCIK